ncbi:MAG: DUF2867 domain-containing protein [Rhizobiaceae bacterium]|nr:DUF2867 domain-containing protein [Rhizobiaceae bacterium]
MQSFAKPHREPDFKDCFSGANAYPEKSAKELAELALASSPFWFRVMFAMRQKLANIVGLRTKTDQGENPGVSFLLSLPELENTETAYEAGLADKHLDFTIRLEKTADRVNLMTQIWFNNFWGKIYLKFVLPFHNMIVSHWVKKLGRIQ